MSRLIGVLRAGYVGNMPSAFAVPVGSLSAHTVAAARATLAGGRHGWARYLAFAGPAIVASIAYMDPGNFATNLVAMLFQALPGETCRRGWFHSWPGHLSR
jgi:hypothetical protein